MALAHFNKTEEWDAIATQAANRMEARGNFNGIIVSKLTGLTKKPLGDFIKKFKDMYTEDDIRQMSEEEIREAIMKEWNDRALTAEM
jgi:hypothetical protein